jgi:hypothetical protein
MRIPRKNRKNISYLLQSISKTREWNRKNDWLSKVEDLKELYYQMHDDIENTQISEEKTSPKQPLEHYGHVTKN